MNTDDINLAYKIRHALNDNLDALPASTTERLAAARALALSRKKPDAAPGKPGKRPLFDFNALFTGPALARIAVAVPMLALVIGMGGVYQVEQQQRLAAMAEIDAAVLADELPLTAYLDHGFNAYVESQQRHQ
ncbi:DUF3619 family protein [Massilia sp. IC2-477]|uniref:DUF3619 family protein n=1 Tax=unclassified Massilia TaxID=2609279 RepID=UPI001D10F957|nr:MULTISPECIES: DUF3619 family protein [unclassified Massilia]MCC2955801.1 DUF3619 family protein [Massilia sp. IC2-477]MCC2970392.1 DUF3619 family protein [Massilia sp. IC2-476]